jgi:hypothetical protein
VTPANRLRQRPGTVMTVPGRFRGRFAYTSFRENPSIPTVAATTDPINPAKM